MEDKLHHLAFIPGDVDTFIAQFESLALEATYDLNVKLTLSLFASKLLFRMMDHVYKVAHPQDFQQWAEVVWQYHQDNMAVQNIRGIYKDNPKKQSSQKKCYARQAYRCSVVRCSSRKLQRRQLRVMMRDEENRIRCH